MPVQLSGLLGSNAKFVANTNTNWYSNGVLNLNSISQKTLAGYLFGGIRADLPNAGGLSVANDTIYRIYIEPDTTVSIKKIPEEFAFLDVFPNPASSKLFIRFQLKEQKNIAFSIYTLTGEKVKEVAEQKYRKGTNNVFVELNDLNAGIYFLRCNTGNSVITKKILINH